MSAGSVMSSGKESIQRMLIGYKWTSHEFVEEVLKWRQ
jgi:hypothetical protein